MAYIDGYVAAVPTANREVYRAHALKAGAIFKKHGALAVVEGWGDDVPEGKLTSFTMAVQRKPDETVVFAWVTWPSKEVRDGAWPKMMAEMEAMSGMPFDGNRMIYGGFTAIVEL
jgi:uncharacterized protein YbaA (DUF1428 family)